MDTIGVYGHEVTGEVKEAASIIDKVFARLIPPICKWVEKKKKSPEPLGFRASSGGVNRI